MSGASLRRVIHAATASVLILIPLTSIAVARIAIISIAILALAVDLARLRLPRFGAWLASLVPVFRPPESKRLSGATWLWVAYALAIWFPEPAARSAILVGALADPAASLVGERVARSETRKTWVGSAVFLVVATACVAVAGFGWRRALLAAVAGAVVERWPGRLDDNLLVSPAVAVVIAVSS